MTVLNKYAQESGDWKFDLVKLYFSNPFLEGNKTKDTKRSDYLLCRRGDLDHGWESLGTWVADSTNNTLDCEFRHVKNRKVALNSLKFRACDETYGGGNKEKLKLQICNKVLYYSPYTTSANSLEVPARYTHLNFKNHAFSETPTGVVVLQ